MDFSIVIDIINFILIILLMDFFNGIHNNYLGKKLKRAIIVIGVFVLTALVLCCATHFFLAAKIALLILELLVLLSVFITKYRIKKIMQYTDVEAGKEEFFGNQKVMILVPHEDDDINLAGGVIEEYIKHGSTVYVVFSTNGDGDERFDMSEMGAIRINEAIKALAVLGVPESNIVFLGYGDGWEKNGPHIYNAPHDKIMQSRAGKRAAYGTASHPAYHENHDYTYSNFFEDIKQVITEHLPDTIFCIDYDTHNDHRALSMLFERVMGYLLRNTDYRPMVYKGYGYRTAWRAPNDFGNTINIASTVEFYLQRDLHFYDWKSRLRFPIDTNSISRNLNNATLYHALSMYDTQRGEQFAGSVINSDKVFWKRRTDSLLYNANITVSSGNKDKLTDFMLLDCDDLISHGDKPFDGVWHPDEKDNEKEFRVTFLSPQYINCIILYDNPSPKNNILNAKVLLDDGTELSTGKLSPAGTSLLIKKKVKSFTVAIDVYEGSNYGLTEIEAYSSEEQDIPALYKITDDQDNFVYDYITSPDGKQIFHIYSNLNRDIGSGFSLHCDNRKCRVKLNGEEITVTCPRGEKCIITLLDDKEQEVDRVLIRNPKKSERAFLQYWVKQLDRITLGKVFSHRLFLLVFSKHLKTK